MVSPDQHFSTDRFKEMAREGDVSAYVDLSVAATAELIHSEHPDAAEMVLSILQLHDDMLYDIEVEALRCHDLTVPSFHVLFIVALAGSIDSRDVTRISRKSRAALSAIVKTLVTKSLIQKKPDLLDKRKIRLFVTELGRTTFLSAWRDVHLREVAWATQLDHREREDLTRLLRKLHGTPPPGVHRRT